MDKFLYNENIFPFLYVKITSCILCVRMVEKQHFAHACERRKLLLQEKHLAYACVFLQEKKKKNTWYMCVYGKANAAAKKLKKIKSNDSHMHVCVARPNEAENK